MKKVTLADAKADPINFLVRGQRHSASAVEVVIDKEGVVVDDRDAVIIEDRLGAQVKVADLSDKELAALAKDKGKSGGDDGDDNQVPEPTDAVKKFAEENGIDLATVKGTGAKGNIIKKDVEDAIAAKADA